MDGNTEKTDALSVDEKNAALDKRDQVITEKEAALKDFEDSLNKRMLAINIVDREINGRLIAPTDDTIEIDGETYKVKHGVHFPGVGIFTKAQLLADPAAVKDLLSIESGAVELLIKEA